MQLKNNKTVFVAMSGGVDSSVAAGLLKQAGYKVVGVTMCFNINNPATRRPSCCGMEGIEDAKRAARILDIPHYVLNFGREIQQYVIKDFIQEYQIGRTPNPCVRCNQYLKFGSLLRKVRKLGADYLATGHYSRLELNRRSRRFELKKGKDQFKDQSYFLYGLEKEILPQILFPLGNLTKTRVRQIAKKFGLANADKPGSQDICFIPDTGYQKFLEEHLGAGAMTLGPFKDATGKIVGEHKGISRYTIGQRDKLGIALGKPAYVYKIDKTSNTIFVGDSEKLLSRVLIADHVNFIGTQPPKKKLKVRVKIRYNHSEVPATVMAISAHKVRVDFAEAQRAVTPGQSVVFYKGAVVLGGGLIEKAL